MHTHRHIHAHTDTHMHTHGKGNPACHPAGGLSCPELPAPPTPLTGTHLLLHWSVFVHPLGVWPSHGQTLVALKCQPHPVELQAPGLVTSTKGRAGRQEGWRGCACVSQQAGSERPLLAGSRLSHLAEQRQWWLPGGPASFPQAEPWVLECPVNSLAGTQPNGAQGGFPGRVARAPGSKLGQGRGP